MNARLVVKFEVPLDLTEDEIEYLKATLPDMVREVLQKRKQLALEPRPSLSRAEMYRKLVELFLDDESSSGSDGAD